MIKNELGMIRTSLQLNARKPSYVASHTALIFTSLIIGVSLALAPEYLLPNGHSLFPAESETLIRNILTTLFTLLLLYMALRSLFGPGIRSYVSKADAGVLALTPVSVRSIIMAKCAKNLVSKLFFVFLAFFTVFPVAMSLGTPPPLFVAALLSLTLYIEFLHAASSAIQSAADAFRFGITSRAKTCVKLVTVMFSAMVLLAFLVSAYFPAEPLSSMLGGIGRAMWAYMPSAVAASSILELMLGRAGTVAFDLGLLAAFLVVAILAEYVFSGMFHPELLAPHRFPSVLKSPVGFRISRFLEERFSWESPARIVFLKDLQLTLRGALMDFSLLNFVAMYGVSLAAWYLIESFVPVQVIPDFEEQLGPLRTFVKEFIVILALLPFIPALTSFSRELGKIWILKAFPFKSQDSIKGKFLFALFISTASLVPMVLAADWVFNLTFSELMLGILLPLILPIANSFGVLTGAYLPPYDLDNQMSLKSISIYFISLIIVLAPFTIIISAQTLLAQLPALALLTAYSLMVTTLFLGGASRAFEKLELRKVLPRNPNVEQATPKY
jgi:hypothetical protein